MAKKEKKQKSTRSIGYYIDGFFDLIVMLFVYSGRIIKSIVGFFTN